MITDCRTIEPVTAAVALTELAITELAITSGAGMGNSPKKGILKVATVSTFEVFSRFCGRFVGICSGFIFNSYFFTFSSF